MLQIAESRIFIADPEWSKAGNAAIDVTETLKAWKNDFAWVSPLNTNFCNRSSAAVAERWKYLTGIILSLRVHGDRFSKSMMAGIEDDLRFELKMLDEANLDFDSSEASKSIDMLKSQIGEYAYVIVIALKKHMDDDERERFEMEF